MVETVLFVIFGIAAVGGALAMVWARNPVYSAMGLMVTMFSTESTLVLRLQWVRKPMQEAARRTETRTAYLTDWTAVRIRQRVLR